MFTNNLQYKQIPTTRSYSNFTTKRKILLNYYDSLKLLVKKKSNFKQFSKSKIGIKSEFSKIYLKKNGKRDVRIDNTINFIRKPVDILFTGFFYVYKVKFWNVRLTKNRKRNEFKNKIRSFKVKS